MFRPVSPFHAATARSLYEAGLAAIRAGQSSIDLGELTSADSTAIAALVGWRRAASRQGSVLTFTNVPANLHSLATLYGVAGLLLNDSGTMTGRSDLPHH